MGQNCFDMAVTKRNRKKLLSEQKKQSWKMERPNKLTVFSTEKEHLICTFQRINHISPPKSRHSRIFDDVTIRHFRRNQENLKS